MAIYNFPEKGLVNRNIPKTKFYEHANISRSVKEAFVNQIQQITWAYKLSPETTNLVAANGVNEIQVFNLHLKTPQLEDGVLLSIDKAIPHPIIFQLLFEDKIRIVLAYKRMNESDESKWVVEQYFSTVWLSLVEAESTKQLLPIALNISGLYEQMLKALMPIEANVGESLKDQTERLSHISQKQKEIAQLQSKMRNEKQFNRKVAMNDQLKTLQTQLAQLQA
jgi:hypothetical protein